MNDLLKKKNGKKRLKSVFHRRLHYDVDDYYFFLLIPVSFYTVCNPAHASLYCMYRYRYVIALNEWMGSEVLEKGKSEGTTKNN